MQLLDFSGAVRHIYVSLGFKGLNAVLNVDTLLTVFWFSLGIQNANQNRRFTDRDLNPKPSE